MKSRKTVALLVSIVLIAGFSASSAGASSRSKSHVGSATANLTRGKSCQDWTLPKGPVAGSAKVWVDPHLASPNFEAVLTNVQVHLSPFVMEDVWFADVTVINAQVTGCSLQKVASFLTDEHGDANVTGVTPVFSGQHTGEVVITDSLTGLPQLVTPPTLQINVP